MLNINKIESTINSKNISIAELARILGEPYTTIVSRKKKGTWTPDDVEKIADFSGKSILYFFDREESKPGANNSEMHSNTNSKHTVYNCLDCIEKENTIKDLRKTIELQNELLEHYRPKKERDCS